MRIPEHCPLPEGAVVWAYLRDSGGTNQDRSVAQQRDTLRRYCEKNHLVLDRVYADEATHGDFDVPHDALDTMLLEIHSSFPQIHDRRRRAEKVESHPHGLIVWTLARLGRDRTHGGIIRNDLRLRGWTILSLVDDILTGNEALDPVLEELLSFKYQMDLNVMSREVKRGLHHIVGMRDTDPGFLAQNPGWESTGRYLGLVPIRFAPTGFRFERVVIGVRRDGRLREAQRLVPVPETRNQAILAWRMRAEDHASYRDIDERLHLLSSRSSYSSLSVDRVETPTFQVGRFQPS